MVVLRRKGRKNIDQVRRSKFEKLESRNLLAVDIEFRSFDGTGNNQSNDNWGVANTPLVRLTTVEYGAGTSGDFPAMAPRLDSAGKVINPRAVSNFLFDQDVSVLNDRGLTSFVFQWGQFLDHDMDLTEDFVPVGRATLDGEFIPFFVTNPSDELPMRTMIPMLRSRFALDSDGVAQQINQITSYIDASNVYGSDIDKANGLRAHYGGFLLTSDGSENLADGSGEFLPFNFEIDGEFLENASPPTTGTGVAIHPDDLFIAGDVRSNEQPGLTSLHTLFVREHNFQARRIANDLGLEADDLGDSEIDEYIFQHARAIVNAEIQSITYNEFIPSLLGPDQLATYNGYQDNVNPGIANIFSSSLYRVGHTMLPNELLLLDANGDPVPDNPDVLGASVENGAVDLSQAFFNPELVKQFGIEPYLKGLTEQRIQEVDNLIIDAVRNMLFDPPAAIDLGATNLQRGRDHGLPDYNQARIDFGLEPRTSFAEISSDPSVVAGLQAAYDAANDGEKGYDAINNIDVFAGAISEDHIAGGSVGELIQTVLVDQFTRLRDGDRFFYENVFTGRLLDELQNTRLSDIIRRNTSLTHVQDEVFRGNDVLTFRAEEGEGSVNLTLRVNNGELQVVKGGNQVLASQAVTDTNIVVIYGTSKNDMIRIDASVAANFDGSIELHGGGGNSDRLIISGMSSNDEVLLASSEVSLNGMPLYFGNFEKLSIGTTVGDALASIGGRGNANLTVALVSGNAIQVSGNGDDAIPNGSNRDKPIGGDGNGVWLGSFDQDLLAAGTSSVELDVMQETGIGSTTASNRVTNESDAAGNGNVSSDDEEAVDFLFGESGKDEFLHDALNLAVDCLFDKASD